jgi:hypothetical protein
MAKENTTVVSNFTSKQAESLGSVYLRDLLARHVRNVKVILSELARRKGASMTQLGKSSEQLAEAVELVRSTVKKYDFLTPKKRG